MLLMLISSNILGQFTRVGVTGGMNLSKARITDGLFAEAYGSSDFSQVTGVNGGFLLEGSSNNIFVTDFGVITSLKGFKDDSMQVNLTYIQSNLVFKIRFQIYGPVSLHVGFGPYAAIAFLGKEKDKTTNISYEDVLGWTRKAPASYTEADKLKPWYPLDLGMTFGGDIEVKLPNKNILLAGAYYELGLSKISNEFPITENSYRNPGVKITNIAIKISYLFDIEK